MANKTFIDELYYRDPITNEAIPLVLDQVAVLSPDKTGIEIPTDQSNTQPVRVNETTGDLEQWNGSTWVVPEGAPIPVNGNASMFHLSNLQARAVSSNALFHVAYSPMTGTLLADYGCSAYAGAAIPRSTDGGLTWADAGAVSYGRYYVYVNPANGHFYGCDDFNGYTVVSEDDGLTWRNSAAGGLYLGQQLSSGYSHLQDPVTGRIYFYKSDGTTGRYTDDFDTFTSFTPVGFGGIDSKYSLRHKPTKFNGVYVFGTVVNGIAHTTDFINWTTVANTNTNATIRTVYPDAASSTLWCLSSNGLVKGIYKSTDMGVTWEMHSTRYETSTGTHDLGNFAYIPEIGLFITNQGVGKISASTDGINWTGYTIPGTVRPQRIQWLEETKQLFILGQQAAGDTIVVSR